MLEHLRQLGKSSTDPADQAIGRMAEAGLIVRGGIDIPFPSILAPVSNAAAAVEKPAVKTPEADLIGSAITEYKTKSLTPEIVNATWQTLWKVWGERVGQEFDVPSCNRTPKELAQLQKENEAVLLIPDNVDLVTLGKIFPQMGSWVVSEGTAIAEQSKGGSIDIAMDLNSPHGDTTEGQANNLLKLQGRDGQRLETYIVGSQLSKLLTGYYFDEDSWSRLPGSRRWGDMVRAHFSSDGYLHVFSNLSPQDHNPRLGFRSEGAKKA